MRRGLGDRSAISGRISSRSLVAPPCVRRSITGVYFSVPTSRTRNCCTLSSIGRNLHTHAQPQRDTNDPRAVVCACTRRRRGGRGLARRRICMYTYKETNRIKDKIIACVVSQFSPRNIKHSVRRCLPTSASAHDFSRLSIFRFCGIRLFFST